MLYSSGSLGARTPYLASTALEEAWKAVFLERMRVALTVLRSDIQQIGF
jgi:hypothetical protein